MEHGGQAPHPSGMRRARDAGVGGGGAAQRLIAASAAVASVGVHVMDGTGVLAQRHTWPAQGFFWLRRQAVSLVCIWCEHEPAIGSSWALGSFFPWSPSGDTLRAGEPPTLTLSRSGTRPARPRCTLRQGRSAGWRGCTAKLSTGATMSPVASAKVIGHATVTPAGTFVA